MRATTEDERGQNSSISLDKTSTQFHDLSLCLMKRLVKAIGNTSLSSALTPCVATPSPQGLSVLQQFKGPFDVHAVAHPCHTQVYQVLLLQRGQVGALDLIVQESVPVLPQVEALQPVGHIMLAPQLHGFGGEGFARGRHGLHQRERRRRARAPAAATRGAETVGAAASHRRGGQAEDVGERGRHGGRQ